MKSYLDQVEKWELEVAYKAITGARRAIDTLPNDNPKGKAVVVLKSH